MDEQRTRLLVLEDQPFFAQLLYTVLASSGFEVCVARDGWTALRRVETFRPHVVMLDIDMPGLDGLDVLERLRAKHVRAALPIMMASARGEPSTVKRAADLGADLFLKKPYSIKDVIERVFALRQTEDEVRTAELLI